MSATGRKRGKRIRYGFVNTAPDPESGIGRLWSGRLFHYAMTEWRGPADPVPGTRVTFAPRGRIAFSVRTAAPSEDTARAG